MLDRVVHEEVDATLTWLKTKDEGVKDLLDKAYGYAVFPEMGRSGLVFGGARGGGEVFEKGKPIGLATLGQLTIGVQVGGQTFSELVVFHDKASLDAFKKGRITFNGNASAVIVKAAATGTLDSGGMVNKAYSHGGLLLELTLGGQSFKFLKHDFKFLENKESNGKEEGRNEDGKHTGVVGRATGAVGRAASHLNPLKRDGDGHHQHGEVKASHDGEEGVEPAQMARPAAGEDKPKSGEQEQQQQDKGEGSSQDEQEGQQASGGEDTREHKEDWEGGLFAWPRRLKRRVLRKPRQLMSEARGTLMTVASKGAEFLDKHGGKGGKFAMAKFMLTGKGKVRQKITWAVTGLAKEAKIAPVLGATSKAALERMKGKKPGLAEAIEKSYGYAVLPNVAKAGAVLGGSYGKGELFERGGKLSGYIALAKLTIGVQLGGETFDELILFENKNAFDDFKKGKIKFSADASVAIANIGAAISNDPSGGMNVNLKSDGGFILEAAIGGQKFVYRPKVLGGA